MQKCCSQCKVILKFTALENYCVYSKLRTYAVYMHVQIQVTESFLTSESTAASVYGKLSMREHVKTKYSTRKIQVLYYLSISRCVVFLYALVVVF